VAEHQSAVRLAAPLARVIPAAALAARRVRNGVSVQTETSLVCQGSWLRLLGNRMTIQVDVSGVDGDATVKVVGSSFGVGPVADWRCRSDVETFVRLLAKQLDEWALVEPAAPAAMPPPAPGSA
jgi:hypothetical protein